MGRTLRKILFLLIASGFVVIGLVLWLTAPVSLDDTVLPDHEGDVKNGAVLFSAAGCASCHGDKDNPTISSGGAALKTPVGSFYPPNLTSDTDTGLGGWSKAEFASAVLRGVSPAGEHYFPAFPYASYQHMRLTDVLDIWAYLKTMAPVKNATSPSPFPFESLVRRFVGVWKYFAMEGGAVRGPAPIAGGVERGRYLVASLGRCGECHTSRNLLFVMKTSRFLKGGRHPEGKGKVPDITATGRLGKWSIDDLASVLETGMLPDFSDDISSGGMDKVLKGLKALAKEDLRAIAAYLKSIP